MARDWRFLLRTLLRHLPMAKWRAFWNRIQGMVHKVQRLTPDAQVIQLLEDFFVALEQPEAQRLEAVLPLLHRSLHYLQADGTTVLTRSVAEFAYPKALRNLNLYKRPVAVSEVLRGQDREVGQGASAERGRVDRYFIAQKEFSSRPVPVGIFIPADGGDPKIENFASL